MCGRARCALDPHDILQLLKLNKFKDPGHQYHPSFNAAPQSFQPVIIPDKDAKDERVVMAMKWGLVPSFFSPSKQKMQDLSTINARVEKLTSSSMWKRLVDKRRCVVVAEGYYEWRATEGRKKQPYFIHMKGQKLTLFAGLYDVWVTAKKKDNNSPFVKKEEGLDQQSTHGSSDEEEDMLFSYAIVTMDPIDEISHIHNRMPLILDTEEKVEKWLHPEKYSFAEVLPLVLPKRRASGGVSAFDLEYFEVPDIVGNIRNNSPECCMPLSEWKKTHNATNFFRPYVKKEEQEDVKKDTLVSIKQEQSHQSSSPHFSASSISSMPLSPVKASVKRERDEPSTIVRTLFPDDDLFETLSPSKRPREDTSDNSTNSTSTSTTTTKTLTTTTPTSSPSKPKQRKKCVFGASCYRKNPIHFREECHPSDPDWSNN
eukprot:TRINITY_DN4774_c0_g1_i1.p1 TRINITY_DN4774_c0_g1~~TRINITY_DN4774_c0_g1_i1.p1  ORF type:complete len:455 (+),score=116.49 TRINITY_DN4774_c0_g1_i1:83-1366(+)